MEKSLAIILAGGRGERLGVLSNERTKPAIPFGGKYRVIDFTLSNCVNSGISKVAIITQYEPLSLIDHIGVGTPWGLSHIDGSGLKLLQPYLAHEEGRDWYKGTADSVYQNLNYIESEGVDHVFILSGDHVYRMNYADMFEFHNRNEADVTIATTPMPYEVLSAFGTVTINDDSRITDFQEKSKKTQSNLVSMGIYLFSQNALQKCLEDDARLRSSRHDFGRNVFPRIVAGDYRIFAYNFHGYWRDVGTIISYWESNMELLDWSSSLLYDSDWPIRTKEELRPPAIVSQKGHIVNSIVSCGCVIEGTVEHSVISPGVRISEGVVVKDSIILSDSIVLPNSVIDYSILDKNVVVGDGCHIGWGDNFQINRREPKVVNTGITIVGKRTRIPDGIRIGRNCIIYNNVVDNDFSASEIPSGETVRPKRRRSA